MFDVNGWEFFALLMLALLIFGERLPKVIGDGMRMLRNLRRLATNATTDLSRELGTDISIDDLNPKNFVRKHLLSEEDEAALRKPIKGLYDDIKADAQQIGKAADLNDVAPSASGSTVPAKRPSFEDAT